MLMKSWLGSVIIGLLAAHGTSQAAPKGKILVVFSSEAKITVVKDRKTGETVAHPTGFFLPELMVPLKKAMAAGYEPVFASPKGTEPVMDKVSDSAFWFHGDEKRYRDVRGECEALGVCGKELRGTIKTEKLSDVRAGGHERFAAIFVPGGHAPMEDLWKDADLGALLKQFHAAGKPTALICHGPIALLSALSDPQAYAAALAKGDEKAIAAASAGWIYRGYDMTVFSTNEERQEEPGEDNVLGGYVRFYPDNALDNAGGRVLVRGAKWRENVIVDRELVTGQNPFSDEALGNALVKALRKYALRVRR